MHIRVLDLDGSIPRQTSLLEHYRPVQISMRSWGRRIRMACSFGRFRRFEQALARAMTLEERETPDAALTFYGSGDFHHVSLALLRRLPGPFNLLVLDNHPDWMRAVPFLHCGTWLYHAARLPQVKQIFHVGGNVDFDNGFRRLAPWPLLRSGKLAVFPGMRYYQSGRWPNIAHEPVRPNGYTPVSLTRLDGLLYPYRERLRNYPLYISLDKDVLVANEAAVNWDSGHLSLLEVEDILKAFVDAADGKLAGMDIVGDWSPVKMRGLFRWFWHWTEHPRLAPDPAEATRLNERTNLALLNGLPIHQAERLAASLPTLI